MLSTPSAATKKVQYKLYFAFLSFGSYFIVDIDTRHSSNLCYPPKKTTAQYAHFLLCSPLSLICLHVLLFWVTFVLASPQIRLHQLQKAAAEEARREKHKTVNKNQVQVLLTKKSVMSWDTVRTNLDKQRQDDRELFLLVLLCILLVHLNSILSMVVSPFTCHSSHPYFINLLHTGLLTILFFHLYLSFIYLHSIQFTTQ